MNSLLKIFQVLDAGLEVTFRRRDNNRVEILICDYSYISGKNKKVMRTVQSESLIKFKGGIDQAVCLEIQNALDQMLSAQPATEPPPGKEGS